MEGILALMIPITALMIPIVAIVVKSPVGHALAERIKQPQKQGASGELFDFKDPRYLEERVKVLEKEVARQQDEMDKMKQSYDQLHRQVSAYLNSQASQQQEWITTRRD